MISQDTFAHIFGYAPLILGVLIVLVAYLMVRGQESTTSPIGQTFACGNCGRRGIREHMVPQAHEGAVSWFCGRCSGAH